MGKEQKISEFYDTINSLAIFLPVFELSHLHLRLTKLPHPGKFGLGQFEQFYFGDFSFSLTARREFDPSNY